MIRREATLTDGRTIRVSGENEADVTAQLAEWVQDEERKILWKTGSTVTAMLAEDGERLAVMAGRRIDMIDAPPGWSQR